jgi:hypothetical protein
MEKMTIEMPNGIGYCEECRFRQQNERGESVCIAFLKDFAPQKLPAYYGVFRSLEKCIEQSEN